MFQAEGRATAEASRWESGIFYNSKEANVVAVKSPRQRVEGEGLRKGQIVGGICRHRVKGSDFTPRWMVWGKPHCDLHVKIPFWLPCEEQSLGDMNEYKEMG